LVEQLSIPFQSQPQERALQVEEKGLLNMPIAGTLWSAADKDCGHPEAPANGAEGFVVLEQSELS
jgi:hypothetical protein